jgi:hypothetical protein
MIKNEFRKRNATGRSAKKEGREKCDEEFSSLWKRKTCLVSLSLFCKDWENIAPVPRYMSTTYPTSNCNTPPPLKKPMTSVQRYSLEEVELGEGGEADLAAGEKLEHAPHTLAIDVRKKDVCCLVAQPPAKIH